MNFIVTTDEGSCTYTKVSGACDESWAHFHSNVTTTRLVFEFGFLMLKESLTITHFQQKLESALKQSLSPWDHVRMPL